VSGTAARSRVLLLAAALVVAGTAETCDRHPPGTALVKIAVEGDSVRVLGAWPLKAPIRPRRAAPPRVRTDSWRSLAVDTDEIAVVLHDRNGDVLRTIGRPRELDGWFDLPEPNGRMRGGLRRLRPAERVFQLPVPRGTSFVSFFETELRVDPDSGDVDPTSYPLFQQDAGPDGRPRTFGARPLGSFELPDAWDGSPPRPHAPLSAPSILGAGLMLQSLSGYPESMLDPSVYGGTETPRTAVVDDPYTIVIVGDGFTEEEREDYLTVAEAIAAKFEVTPPFSDHLDRITLQILVTYSVESGITKCPEPDMIRDTFYGVTGEYEGLPQPGYVGLSSWENLYLQADAALDGAIVDLFIVVANCDTYGGSGQVDHRTALVTTPRADDGTPDTELIAELVMHESGHAVANLAEEYFGQCYEGTALEWWPCSDAAAFLEDLDCTTMQTQASWYGWPNVVHASTAEEAWWKAGAETDAEGGFLHVHFCEGVGCSSCGGTHGTHEDDGLGLYWGSHFVEPGFAGECSSEAGADFYRPAADCRMRGLGQPFCEACRQVIAFYLENP
jgi:hypothetical protein